MDDNIRKRSYSSDLRQANAQATRLRIAEAARTLMLERGYAATTMTDVAQAAGVAVQTLYSSCPGGKPGLAKLVYDVTLAGDAQPLPQSARPQVQAIIAEPDPVQKLARYAAMAVTVFQRVGPVQHVLRAAAAATPTYAGLDALLASVEHQRLIGSRGLAEHLFTEAMLHAGLTAERAADQIYALTSTEVFERLTGICHWSTADYQDWLARTMTLTLLKPSPTPD